MGETSPIPFKPRSRRRRWKRHTFGVMATVLLAFEVTANARPLCHLLTEVHPKAGAVCAFITGVAAGIDPGGSRGP